MSSQLNTAKRHTNATSWGISIWLILIVAASFNLIRLNLIELLFLLAPWVIAPTASLLLPPVNGSPLQRLLVRTQWPIFVAAALATSSFLLPAGPVAGALASCWLLVCLAFALDCMIRIWKWRLESFSQVCFAAGEAYIAVGGVWLVMSRLGMQPVGFVEPIVLLTAVHFHFAGFLSCIFAGLTFERLRTTGWVNSLRIVLLAVICGPGLLGLAFLVGPKPKLIAAMLVAIGQIGLAVAMVKIALVSAHGLPKFLLIGSALSVAVGMAFAAMWALGEYPLQPMTDLSQMAHVHGVLNAAGFGFLGLLGWKGIHSSIGRS